MTFRLDEFRAKVQFVTSARMPYDIYQACLATGTCSNTAYIQRAVCEALSRDLGVPLAELLSALPPPRGPSGALFHPEGHPMSRYGMPIAIGERTGPAGTDEDVR